MCFRWVDQVTSSCNVILNTRVSDVLKVVIVATHVRSDVVLFQEWLELMNEGIRWTVLSN